MNEELAVPDGPSGTSVGIQFLMGITHGSVGRRPFYLTEESVKGHSCILGQTGSGKTKFLELLMRYWIASGRGFALIDPHGDLTEDLLAYAAHRKLAKRDDRLISRIHYLEPSYEQVFHYDPFRYRPRPNIPDYYQENAYVAWMNTKADRIGEIVQRKQGSTDFQNMARLQRHLKNVLMAVGTHVDRSGKHLPLADALVLLDRHHPRHQDVFGKVAGHLPQETLSDFTMLHAKDTRRSDYDRMTESTVNRLRSILSPLVKSIFSEQVETIDFQSIIQNGEILLINLRETDYFSADQANAIGGMFIHELFTTAQNTPRTMRKTFPVIIDEAGEFIGGDIQRALGILRKFRMPVTLAAQDLSTLKKDDLDLRPKVLSQCSTIISYRQTWPEDVDILARVMCIGNLDFSKYYQTVERDDRIFRRSRWGFRGGFG